MKYILLFITTNLINEFVTDFGTSNFDDNTNERIMNILSY